MKLKALIAKLDEVPEALQGFYEPVDASDETQGFQLAMDDSPVKAKINEFRQRNVALLKKQEELQATVSRFDGIDPEKHRKALKALQQVESEADRIAIEEGRWQDVVDRRTGEMKKDLEAQRDAKAKLAQELENKYNGLAQQYRTLQINNSVQAAIEKSGIRPRAGALEDIYNRTRSIFTMDENGQLKAVQNGEPIFGKKGEPLSMEEHIQRLAESASFLFDAPAGGGSNGNNNGTGNATGKVVIANNDPETFGRNLEAIAKGQAVFASDQ